MPGKDPGVARRIILRWLLVKVTVAFTPFTPASTQATWVSELVQVPENTCRMAGDCHPDRR
jgi:hypothetical protein